MNRHVTWAAACLAASAFIASPVFGQDSASVSVVHGIPGVVVDVYVGGVKALPGFEPGDVAGPIDLEAGSTRVQIVAAGEMDLENAVIDETLDVPAGASLTLVAHLDEAGSPALTAFANDLSDPGAGRGRVVVRHAAAAPEVDVLLLKRWWPRAVLRGLENGDQSGADVAEGEYSAYVLASATRRKVAGPLPVSVAEGKVLVIHAVGSLAAGSFGVVAQTLSTEPPPASVTVVHGVPGLVVDVYVNGDLFLPGFEPRTITDPVELPAGVYSIAIAPEGAGVAAAVISADVEVTPGLEASIVAHLDAGGAPTASVFVDDTSRARFGKGRITVRHVAAAPEVDVRLARHRWRTWKVEGVANGEQASVEALAGRYQLSVLPAGGDEAVLGPATLKVLPGTVTTAYAIGSLADGSLDLLTNVRQLEWPRLAGKLLRRAE